VDFDKLFTETNKQKFSLRGVQCQNICSHPGENSILNVQKGICAGVEVSHMEGKKDLSVNCVELIV